MRKTRRAPCPQCDRGPTDRALVITEDDRGVVQFCHRCRFTASDSVSAGVTAVLPRHHRAWADLAGPLWDRALPIPGTLAEKYLLSRRCALPPRDADLRFLPARGDYPAAMVAKVTDARTASSLTLQITELSPTGEKLRRRLLAGYPKRGGVIRLWPDDAVTQGLAIGEGIETSLSVAHIFQPAWAAVDAGNLAALPVLPGIEALVIFADNDPAGINAARASARRWRDAERNVRIVAPRRHNDFNDVITEERTDAAA